MSNNKFDIILVYTNFRRHENFLEICKTLAGKYTIGIYVSSVIEEETDKIFLAKCKAFGATDVPEGSSCKILLIPRFGVGFLEKILQELPKKISFEKVFITTVSAFSGVPYAQEIHQSLGNYTVLAPDLKLFGLFEADTREYIEKNHLPVVEAGVPFKKHQVFTDLDIDYLIAYPSHVSVKSPAHEYGVIRNLYHILNTIPSSKKVYVKVHNVLKHGNRLSHTYFFSKRPSLKFFMGFFLAIAKVMDLKIGGRPLYSWMPERVLIILKKVNNDYIFFRCTNLLNKYPAFGIEHYLPAVKEGVVTGLSNTIPMALMMDVPVMNVDRNFQDLDPNRKRMAEVLKLHQWSGFSKEGFSLFEKAKKADIIQILESNIGGQ